MPKNAKTPSSVLLSLMAEYQLNPFLLSKKLKLSASSVRNIIFDNAGISVPTAFKLSKFFGQSPDYWLDLQRVVDKEEAEKNKKLQAELKSIRKVEKPGLNAGKQSPAKARKKPTLADRRKRAAKIPGSKPASRSRR